MSAVVEVPQRGALAALIVAMRPRQWAKHVLVFAAPLAAGALFEPSVLWQSIGAFIAFCLISSATYLLNDVRDVASDRDHPSKRARPIVMTTIAMVAGMVPSALGIGDGGEFRAPMAIGVIGGLIVSTMLSLVFVPAVFTIMDDVGRVTWRLFSRFFGPRDEDEE